MSIAYLARAEKPRLAYRFLPAAPAGAGLPALLFCGGFRSDMEGTKAAFLADVCAAQGQAYVRFDYSGHGASAGRFEDGTIGSWTQDALDILDKVLPAAPVLVAGSSMGGWIALLLALARPGRIAGIIGIAAAPDFTRSLYNDVFDAAARAALARDGFVSAPSAYDDAPYVFTRALIEDGEAHCLLDGTIAIGVPLRLLQGMKDPEVPWQTAYRIRNALADPARAEVLLIESGDHRLSRPEDLALLAAQVQALSSPVGS